MWKGHGFGKIGYLKFVNSEQKELKRQDLRERSACPSTVDELLNRIGLKEYAAVFVLNG
jgi:hypothetical protein